MPHARVSLDTSAYANLRRNHPPVLDLIAAADVVCIPTIVLGELEAGFVLGSRTDENRVMLGEFLAEPFVTIFPVTPAVALRYGALFADLRRAGTPVPVNDIWIAACALDAGTALLTYDRDYEKITGLDAVVLDA